MWGIIIAVAPIHVRSDANLFVVVDADGSLRAVLCAGEGREQKAREDRNNGDDNEQFDECEASGMGADFHTVSQPQPESGGKQLCPFLVPVW